MFRKCPRSFLTFFLWVRKNPAKFPPKLPPQNKEKNSPTSFCSSAGITHFRNPQHGSSDTRLAEACSPKLRNTVNYRVEEMRPKWPFWKHRAPKMRLVEAQCALRKHCYPEIPLGSHPTSRVSQSLSTDLEAIWLRFRWGSAISNLRFNC